jgi:hypothetical protein
MPDAYDMVGDDHPPEEIRVGCKKRSGEGWYARLFDKVVYDVYTQ